MKTLLSVLYSQLIYWLVADSLTLKLLHLFSFEPLYSSCIYSNTADSERTDKTLQDSTEGEWRRARWLA